MTHMFSIKEAVVFGWHKLKSHSALVFGVMLTMFALQVVSSVVQKTLEGTPIGFAASFVLAVAGVVLGAGMTLIFLRLAQGHAAHYRDIVPPLPLVWKYFCVSVLTGVITMLPILAGALVSLILIVSSGAINLETGAATGKALWALIFSGVVMLAAIVGMAYLALRFSMSRLAVLDGTEIIESLRKSTKLTHGIKGRLVLFALALVAINILGALVLLVGLLVSVPVSLLAYAHVYLKLKSHHGHH